MTATIRTSIDHLRLDGVSRAYGDRRVLTDLTLTVDRSERLGLIGENGAGKSTLLRIAAGIEEPDSGTVARPERTGLLWQEVRFERRSSLRQLLEHSLAEVREIERELEASAAALGSEPGAEERYEAALIEAERAEVWSIDSRRDELLDGLGVGGIPLDRRLDAVSGGQRSRFALAALLLSRPTALLLDEPTNHLDDAAVGFLREHLRSWPGPVLFASHDRAFLDEVATSLLDIDPSRSGFTRFGGHDSAVYSEYLKAKADERARWEAQFAAEEREAARLSEVVAVSGRNVAHGRGPRDNDKFIHKFKGAKVQRQIARRVRDAEGRLDDLLDARVGEPPPVLGFTGIPTGWHPLEDDDDPLLALVEARVGHRLEVPSFAVRAASRILVTGGNGAGKSTLLSVLAGAIRPDAGALRRRKGVRVALLEQDVRFADPSQTARSVYERVVGERRAETVPLASLGLLASPDLDRPVGSLSIGQQRRVALALIVAKPPHVFLLDEPTNHLSLTLASELEEALGGYPGAVVVASHDRWLRERWTGERFALGAGRPVSV